MPKRDFGGYATKYGVRCSDGLVIEPDAFAQDNGKRVPVVWNHQHNSIDNVLGYGILEHRNDGTYVNVYLNDTDAGKKAKKCIAHGDIKCLSIWADKLKRSGPSIRQGCIREVSLVLAGANPKATVDEDADVVIHSDIYEDDAATIYCGDNPECFSDSDEAIAHSSASTSQKTNQEIFDSMTDEQKGLVYEMIGAAIEGRESEDEDDEDDSVEQSAINNVYDNGEDNMKHSLFDKQSAENNAGIVGRPANELSHSEMTALVDEAKRYSIKLSEAFVSHGIDFPTYPGDHISHSITDLGYMFPDARTIGNGMPEWIKRDTGWVSYVMSKVHHTPFANVKSMFADITGDDARALGYIKGKLKKEEVFTMLKRTTTPQTVYKKQKLDRDDIIDIANPGLLAWLKSEMRMMLDEELARAFLIGDGRLSSSDDKIRETNIRPIANEEALYKTDVIVTETGDELYKAFIRQVILSRINYKGSGSPDLFCSETMLCNLMLMTDTTGRDLYTDEAALARKLRVNKIVTVPLLENSDIYGIVVNLNDYNVGADQGGAVSMFDDFDIDYNQQKYLIETRCSGALIRPYSAIVLRKTAASGD